MDVLKSTEARRTVGFEPFVASSSSGGEDVQVVQLANEALGL